jgi:GNAT superfamily N-acetyltransferase
MIRLESRELSSEECKILAGITISTRKGTPLESKKSLDEIAKIIEGFTKHDGFKIHVAIDEDGNLVGWTYYYTAFPLMTFISGFYPEVVESHGSEDIEIALIKASKEETVARGHTRLEIELVYPSDVHRAHYERLVELYKKCDFRFAAEEIHMKSNLNEISLPDIDLPEGYTVKNFSDVPYNQIEGPGFDSLIDSKEGLFLSMSLAEQKVTIRYFFDKSKPYIEDASLVLEKDGEIVGYIITRWNDDKEPEIGPVGLVREARGKRLGSYLLVRVLKNLKASGFSRVYLDTTTTNHPAQRLYRKYGFEDVYFKQFYYWSP